MSRVISKDGTEIAYNSQGAGPAAILVEGALGYRGFGMSSRLAELLAPRFMVWTYDRRGRGESSNSKPYAVEREVEDIDALIQKAGGTACVFGTSSGGCLALEAAIRLGTRVRKLAIYEAPYQSGAEARQQWLAYRKQLAEILAAGRKGEAVVLFMRFVGTPDEMIGGMRQSPMWPAIEAVAPTLAYDAAAIGDDRSVPEKRAAQISSPALILNGTVIPFMRDTAAALARAIPGAQHRTLEGQSHDVNLEVLAPVLTEFFA
jgi:pimeloyl-ACP methyl ester carboxylesterase